MWRLLLLTFCGWEATMFGTGTEVGAHFGEGGDGWKGDWFWLGWEGKAALRGSKWSQTCWTQQAMVPGVY